MIMETKLNNDSKNGIDTLLSFFREVKSICKFHALKTTGIRLMASLKKRKKKDEKGLI